MQENLFSRIRKSAACSAGILLLIAVLVSSYYAAAEAGHHCHDHACPVCACMQQCQNILHRIDDGTALRVLSGLPLFLILLVLSVSLREAPQETLISRKVQLNN